MDDPKPCENCGEETKEECGYCGETPVCEKCEDILETCKKCGTCDKCNREDEHPKEDDLNYFCRECDTKICTHKHGGMYVLHHSLHFCNSCGSAADESSNLSFSYEWF